MVFQPEPFTSIIILYHLEHHLCVNGFSSTISIPQLSEELITYAKIVLSLLGDREREICIIKHMCLGQVHMLSITSSSNLDHLSLAMSHVNKYISLIILFFLSVMNLSEHDQNISEPISILLHGFFFYNYRFQTFSCQSKGSGTKIQI